MPAKQNEIASNDYQISKDTVYSLIVGNSIYIDVDNYKRVQKYLYEIGLKCKPRREFSTKKINDYSLRVTRIT